jgi:hypothetical protein
MIRISHKFGRSVFLLIACCGLAGFLPLRAEDIYIAQLARGADSGSDVANAHSVAFFNSADNWHGPAKVAGKIGPGDTVHLVGTISQSLTIQASGTSDNPITILFDQGAKMSAPYWSGAAISIPRKNYIIIDGGATGRIGGREGKPKLANGIIECTDNGTAFGNQVNSRGVSGTECKYLTVRNLVVSNMYVRTRGTEQKSYGVGISNSDTLGNGVNNYLVTNCIVHDAYIGVRGDFEAGDHTYEFSYITAYNCNWGGSCSDRRSTSTLDGLLVHHNYFHSWTNWDDPSINSFHHNGFFAYARSGGSLKNVKFYSNFFGPSYSLSLPNDALRANHATAGIYVSGKADDVLVYNNIFIATDDSGPSNGFVYFNLSGTFTSVGIYNNTFIGNDSGHGRAIYVGPGTGTFIVKNNLGVGLGTFIASFYAKSSILIADHNLGYRLHHRQGYSYSMNGSSSFKTFARWRALGYDSFGSDKNPKLDSNYFPQKGSPAIAGGVDLSDRFTTDRRGTVRPRGQAWTIGAYEAEAVSPP